MSVTIAVPKETAAGERRVAMEVSTISKLNKAGAKVLMESGSGNAARISDDSFIGANFVESAAELYQQADIILKVQPPTVNEVAQMPEGCSLISILQPHNHIDMVKALQERNITSYAMELIPRISRAQAMDVLSSQASVAGYKAAIMGADLATRFFPMLTTAAGTIRPSKVIIIGVGVAGLQAIATSRRLGAIVEAYDVRAATKEQVQSLGAKFIELGISAEGEGGYARELSMEEKQQQQAELAQHLATADVLITTASVPGRPAPKIIPESTVNMMKAGAVIIDLAAESGGNCELTQAGKTITHHDVVIHGPLNIASQVPVHASEMYAKNLYNFLSPMLNDGKFEPDMEDEVIKGALLTHAGNIMNDTIRTLVEG